MNLIEGKIEWCGNGVVVIKERSVMQVIWKFFVRAERQLYLTLYRAVSGLKKQLNKGLMLIENAAETASPDYPSEQDRVVACQPVVAKKKERLSQQIPQQKNRPMGTLTEIRRFAGTGHASSASGDEQNGLQQLLPALAGFCHDRWLVLVSPPQRPDIAALTAAGIDPSRVLLVHARDTQAYKNNADTRGGLNVVERALRSGTCGAVVAWLEECDTPTLQQLRGVAVEGGAWGVMFREAEKEIQQLEMVIG